jgi:hypothetical protein
MCRARKVLDNCTRPICPTANALTRCILLKNENQVRERRRGLGCARFPAIKELYGGYRPDVERLKWLSQIVEERARQLEICGFESFREAIVHKSQHMPGLIALAALAKQAGQDHRRPQLPGEGRLCACDNERFGQAVHDRFTVMLRRENLRFNPEQLGQVQFHSTICRARNGSIDID